MRLNASLLKSTLVAALGGLLFGFDSAVIAGATHALTELYRLSHSMLGSRWPPPSGDGGRLRAGRVSRATGGPPQQSAAHGGVVFVIALGCAFAWNWHSLSPSASSAVWASAAPRSWDPCTSPNFRQPKLRGRLVGFFQFNVVSGILLAYLSNYLLGRGWLAASNGAGSWASPPSRPLFFLVMLFGIPRSPRWLVQKRRVAEARQALADHRRGERERELAEIVASIDAEHGHGREPLFSSKYRLPILLAVSLAMFNQLSGINAILYYLNDIFAKAGFDKVSERPASGRHRRHQPAVYRDRHVRDRPDRPQDAAADRLGGYGGRLARRCVCLLYRPPRIVLLWLLVGFIGFFAFSQGAVIWVYLSEVFPNRVRARVRAWAASRTGS